MGGTKRKSISQAEKSQVVVSRRPEKKGREPAQLARQSRQPSLVPPRMDEKQVDKVLGPLKAVTLYEAAKALGSSVSAASALLKSLESKGVIKKVGGYSGHYVWSLRG